MKLYAYKEINCRKVGGDYLAYSNLSSETLSLSYVAYSTLNLLISSAMTLSDLMTVQKQYLVEFKSDEQLQVLEKTVNELVRRGFIYQSAD